MTLQSIRYAKGNLEVLDQLLLPAQCKYLQVKTVEDGWKVINKMQVCSTFFSFLFINWDSYEYWT